MSKAVTPSLNNFSGAGMLKIWNNFLNRKYKINFDEIL